MAVKPRSAVFIFLLFCCISVNKLQSEEIYNILPTSTCLQEVKNDAETSNQIPSFSDVLPVVLSTIQSVHAFSSPFRKLTSPSIESMTKSSSTIVNKSIVSMSLVFPEFGSVSGDSLSLEFIRETSYIPATSSTPISTPSQQLTIFVSSSSSMPYPPL